MVQESRVSPGILQLTGCLPPSCSFLGCWLRGKTLCTQPWGKKMRCHDPSPGLGQEGGCEALPRCTKMDVSHQPGEILHPRALCGCSSAAGG